MAPGEGHPDSPQHSVGMAPSGDRSQQAVAWEAILGVSPSCSHPLRSLTASGSKREWVRARNQIGISESQGHHYGPPRGSLEKLKGLKTIFSQKVSGIGRVCLRSESS